MDIFETLSSHAYALLTNHERTDRTPATELAFALHPTPPSRPTAIRAHLTDAPGVLPELARYAQAGDPHALLIAAVLMRDQLHSVATHLGGEDAAADTLTAFFTLLRTAAEPQTLTERSIAAQVLRCHHATTSAPYEALPLDPRAPAFDRPQPLEPDTHNRAAAILEQARQHGVITALEHQTLTALYLTGTGRPAAAAAGLHASTSTIERRTQRAIRKLAAAYRPQLAGAA